MNKENTTLAKAVKQAAASIWIDQLPLSKEYVTNYYRKRLIQKRQSRLKYRLMTPQKRLTLKKVYRNGRKSIFQRRK